MVGYVGVGCVIGRVVARGRFWGYETGAFCIRHVAQDGVGRVSWGLYEAIYIYTSSGHLVLLAGGEQVAEQTGDQRFGGFEIFTFL